MTDVWSRPVLGDVANGRPGPKEKHMQTTIADLFSRFWWMILLRGAIAVLFGVVLFAWPGVSLASLVILFGIFVFIDGIGNVVMAFGGRQEEDHWWVLLLAGLAGIAVGILTFLNPDITALVLLFYIAIWAIVTGVLQIVAAIRLRKVIQGEFWMVLGGLASIAFGVFVIARPGQGALAILWLIGAYAIVIGVVLILFAFRARGFVKRVEKAAA